MSVIMIVAFMPSMAFATDSNTWDKNGKFRVELKSGTTTATAEVYDDYSVFGKVVDKDAEHPAPIVNASEVDVCIEMKNVQSLKVDSLRHHDISVKTGITDAAGANLTYWFDNIFGCKDEGKKSEPFAGATLNGTVNGTSFGYKVDPVTKVNDREYTVKATPSGDVSKAWHILASRVEPSKATVDDSQIDVKKGAYLQIRGKVLVLGSDCKVNPSDKTSTKGTEEIIREAATLKDATDSLPEGTTVKAYIPAGSVLQIGASIATLKYDIYMTSDVNVDAKILTDAQQSQGAKQIIKTFVQIVNDVVGNVASQKNVKLDIITGCKVTVEGTKSTYIYGDKLAGLDSTKTWVLEGTNTEVKNEDTVTGDMTIVEKTSGGNTGGGGGPAVVPPATDNVTNNAADKNTTADLTPAVKDNKAETTVDAKTADKIVEKALENKSEEIIVDAAGNNTVASSEVGIPEKTVKELAEKTDANLVIKTDNGKVDLDKTALDAVAAQAGNTGFVRLIIETIKSDENICHVNLKLITSNGAVKDFNGGNVKVTINLSKELAAKELVCVYIDDNGIYTLVEGVLNADGTYTFTTGHFSEYAVMAKAEADKKIAEQLNTLIKEVNLKVRTSKTAKKNIKAVVSGDVKALTDAGYTVKYKFYRSTKKASKYVSKGEKTADTYINTAGKKGTKYYYKAKALVYDGDKLVGQTVLKQCKYGVRTWSK